VLEYAPDVQPPSWWCTPAPRRQHQQRRERPHPAPQRSLFAACPALRWLQTRLRLPSACQRLYLIDLHRSSPSRRYPHVLLNCLRTTYRESPSNADVGAIVENSVVESLPRSRESSAALLDAPESRCQDHCGSSSSSTLPPERSTCEVHAVRSRRRARRSAAVAACPEVEASHVSAERPYCHPDHVEPRISCTRLAVIERWRRLIDYPSARSPLSESPGVGFAARASEQVSAGAVAGR